jgi:hypothetical protein
VETLTSLGTPAPLNGCPNAFVQIVPNNFGDDLEASDRSRNFDPAREKPTDRKRVERSQRPPADGLENRAQMCLCSPE